MKVVFRRTCRGTPVVRTLHTLYIDLSQYTFECGSCDLGCQERVRAALFIRGMRSAFCRGAQFGPNDRDMLSVSKETRELYSHRRSFRVFQ